MEHRGIERRELLKRAGIGSAAVGGLALTAPGVARGSSDDDADAMFVHIDGVVSGTEGTFKIDIDVAGTERELRGEGWDVDPDENHPTACIFVQSGSIHRGIVGLQGRVIFANDPANFGALVKTRANSETGRIDWDFGGFLFTGSGRVVVAEAELEND
ncbi:MAG: twin-arginine translocation signal domain-containing protein [Thermoleophilaceae bacterium]